MRFHLFDMNKDGKGVEKNEDRSPNVGFYFKSLWRKFPRLISINLLMLLQIVPLLAAFLTYFWGDTVPTLTDPSFPIYYGISQFDDSASSLLLLTTSSLQFNVPALSSWDLTQIVLWLLLAAVTFGWCNVAFTYLMREMVKGNPVFLFSDIKYAIQKNWKQGFLVGLADFCVLSILLFNILTMQNAGDAFNSVMYFANLGILILYVVMRFYIYLMLITFDIKFGKMIKNALIFVVLGLKRNVLAVLWIIVLCALNFFILLVYPPLGIALPLLYILSVSLFTVTYAAYPVIERYMITPYQKEEPDTPDEYSSDEIGE